MPFHPHYGGGYARTYSDFHPYKPVPFSPMQNEAPYYEHRPRSSGEENYGARNVSTTPKQRPLEGTNSAKTLEGAFAELHLNGDVPPMPPVPLPDDENQAKMVLAWYYAGYYTGCCINKA